MFECLMDFFAMVRMLSVEGSYDFARVQLRAAVAQNNQLNDDQLAVLDEMYDGYLAMRAEARATCADSGDLNYRLRDEAKACVFLLDQDVQSAKDEASYRLAKIDATDANQTFYNSLVRKFA